MLHSKLDASIFEPHKTSAPKAPLHFCVSALVQLLSQLGSAHGSPASLAQTPAHAWPRSGSPSYQHAPMAPSSFAHTPAFDAGSPFMSHSKLEAGSFARQSVAAETIGPHQVTADLALSHAPTHPPVVALGHASDSSVAHSSSQLLGTPLPVDALLLPPPPPPPPPEPADEPAAHPAETQPRAARKTAPSSARAQIVGDGERDRRAAQGSMIPNLGDPRRARVIYREPAAHPIRARRGASRATVERA